MLGSDRSRSYCLEMICADFLAGANLDSGDPNVLLRALSSAFELVQVSTAKSAASVSADRKGADPMKHILPKQVPLRIEKQDYQNLREQVLRRDSWRCQVCGSMTNLEVHHKQFRSHSGGDRESNLITLCFDCHASTHGDLSGCWP